MKNTPPLLLHSLLVVAILLQFPVDSRANVVMEYTGGVESFLVPNNVSSLDVKIWGAGGGSDPNRTLRAGAGGFASGTLTVTPGSTLSIVVGQGGFQSTGTVFGGGGGGAGTNAPSGGGYSGIFLGPIVQANALIIAGGGGGSQNGSGGAGGGPLGVNGTGWAPGAGGSQTAGGAGSQPGFALQGGTTTSTFGAGGGGGYFGGGASSSGNGGGAGGGSGYLSGPGTLMPGNAFSPPMLSDPEYIQGIGVGAGPISNGIGGHGLVVITTSVPEPSSALLLLAVFATAGIVSCSYRKWKRFAAK